MYATERNGDLTKNTIIGQYRGKAATATNKQFGKIAALTRWK